jgi:tripartite-type tricarboxylate transporter receptor subunit TctC
MTDLSRRALLGAAALCPLAARAQAFPTKPVTLVVPFAAGGSSDILARIIGPEVASELKGTIVIDNKPGANGTIAAATVKLATPDGHTIMLATNSPLSAAPHIYRKIAYHPVNDFTPIIGLGTLPFVVLVNPRLQVKTLAELIDLANRKSGGLSYGSGSTVALATGESIRAIGKASIVNVPYKVGPQALQDTIGGQVDFVIADLASAAAHIKAGSLVPIAVTTAARSKLFPSLPAIAETPAMRGFDLTSWYGIVGPAGVPPAVVKQIAAAFEAALSRVDVLKKAQERSFDIQLQPTDVFKQYVADQVGHWQTIVKVANIQPEG